MNIFGLELDFDFFDADQLEVYERENLRVMQEIKERTQYEGKTTAEAFRIQCGIVDRFFDAIFGAGTAKQLFSGKANLRDHMEAFAIMAKGAEDARKEFDAIEEKYTPNRAERRQTQKDIRQFQKRDSRNYNHNAAGYGKGKNRNR